MFSGFFHRQQPTQWPPAPDARKAARPEPAVWANAAPATRSASAAAAGRSRLTLAASVTLLLSAGLYLSTGWVQAPPAAGTPGSTEPSLLPGATADGKVFSPRPTSPASRR
ncbi:hypothetical protein FRUB_07317 [Fimbriiglobus ruber]|uniref:Uncharacterized protein n=2 Tax=Fimbriiglobus ruber TaxID=1908690 RepID=A0A225DPT7_9BACT|nr:hypothetical protein FRUB_07317 [Fimbriiglobus ruber]